MTAARLLTPRVAAYALAAALALGFADSVFRIPVQVSDSLDAIVASAEAPSVGRLFLDATTFSGATLRPARYVQARWLVEIADATGLSYNAVFRGAHVVLVVLLLLVFAACTRVERWRDVAAFGFCLTVFTGMHTFTAVLREAFPVNHYAEVALSALVVFAVAQRPRHWAAQTLVLALLTFCLLLIESGVLVWVVIVTCAALRMPGLGWRMAVAATLILVLYAGARRSFEIGSPGIGGHDSGYGGVYVSADELRRRFAANPWPFYAYNVASGTLSVLFSEPRFGVYQLLQSRGGDPLPPVVPINMVSSAAVTLALAGYVVSMMRRRRTGLRHEDRTVVVALVVIAASAVLCVTYIKDEIVSTAGMFYALAAFAPARAMLGYAPAGRWRVIGPALVAVFFAVEAPLWAFRTVGSHFELRRTAYITRNDWGEVLLAGDREQWPTDPTELAITRRLKDEALQRRTASPTFMPHWGDRYWVE